MNEIRDLEKMYKRGCTIKEISESLGLTVATIRRYIKGLKADGILPYIDDDTSWLVRDTRRELNSGRNLTDIMNNSFYGSRGLVDLKYYNVTYNKLRNRRWYTKPISKVDMVIKLLKEKSTKGFYHYLDLHEIKKSVYGVIEVDGEEVVNIPRNDKVNLRSRIRKMGFIKLHEEGRYDLKNMAERFTREAVNLIVEDPNNITKVIDIIKAMETRVRNTTDIDEMDLTDGTDGV